MQNALNLTRFGLEVNSLGSPQSKVGLADNLQNSHQIQRYIGFLLIIFSQVLLDIVFANVTTILHTKHCPHSHTHPHKLNIFQNSFIEN